MWKLILLGVFLSIQAGAGEGVPNCPTPYYEIQCNSQEAPAPRYCEDIKYLTERTKMMEVHRIFHFDYLKVFTIRPTQEFSRAFETTPEAAFEEIQKLLEPVSEIPGIRIYCLAG